MADADFTQPQYLQDPKEDYTALDCLAVAEQIATHWWTILNEAHFRGDFPKWYVGKKAGTRDDAEAHSRWLSMAKHLLNLERAENPEIIYEIWSGKGHRLDGGFEFLIDTDREKQKWLDKFPDAFVVRVSVKSPEWEIGDIDLLDTLIGKISLACIRMVPGKRNYELITLRDSTGRCVNVRADVLVAHSIWHRLTESTQERVLLSVESSKKCMEKAQLAIIDTGEHHE